MAMQQYAPAACGAPNNPEKYCKPSTPKDSAEIMFVNGFTIPKRDNKDARHIYCANAYRIFSKRSIRFLNFS